MPHLSLFSSESVRSQRGNFPSTSSQAMQIPQVIPSWNKPCPLCQKWLPPLFLVPGKLSEAQTYTATPCKCPVSCPMATSSMGMGSPEVFHRGGVALPQDGLPLGPCLCSGPGHGGHPSSLWAPLQVRS